jgi:uncharacterized protein YdeI (YjbR/CyaY-like superfamily)
MPAKKDPRVDQYIQDCEPFARPILKHLRKIILGACPEGEETLKWGMPHLMYRGSIVCGFSGFKQHCALGFWDGRDVVGGEKTEGAGHFGKITRIADLPSQKSLAGFVAKAMKLIEARSGGKGKAAPGPRRTPKHEKGPVRAPSDLMRALRGSRKALAHYEAFSPSYKREYVEWIVEAKTEQTRERRIEQAVEWVAEGKSRNWKYRAR